MAVKQLKLTSTHRDQAAVAAAAQVLANGGVIVIPTETVYGVICRADHRGALDRLGKLRNTPAKAMTVHVGSAAAALPYIDPPTAFARRALDSLWPGPVSLIFPVSAETQTRCAQTLAVDAAHIYAGDRVTLRCPSHATALAILSGSAHPIVGIAAAEGASRVDLLPAELVGAVDMILDEGPAPYGKPSTVLELGKDRFDIVRSGVYDRRIIERMLQKTILFVCSGNTCRSPMAEAIARKVIADSLQVPENLLEKNGVTIVSAGASAFSAGPASPNAAEAVKTLGADLSKHRSRPLTQQLVNQATVIFAMAHGHQEVVKMMSPSAKVVLLDPAGDIDDPIGSDLAVYHDLAKKIKQAIERRLQDKSLLGTQK